MFRGIFLRFPEGKKKALTFSYDDGGVGDKRLIDIFNEYNLKGTFNLNTYKDEYKKAEAYKCYEGHEVAVHTENHPILPNCPDTTKLYEIFKCRETLEALTGKITRGMAYPFGPDFSKSCSDALCTAGIVYSRSTSPTYKFSIPNNWYDWRPTCHHNDPKLLELAEEFLTYDDNANAFSKEPLLFYVWGHTYEFNNNNNWHIMENFAKVIANKPDVWYATNIEIYDYVEKFRRLVFSLDSKIIYNPTDTTIYFNINEKEYSIKSGETLKVE